MSLQYSLFSEVENHQEVKSTKSEKQIINPIKKMKEENEKELDIRDVFSAIGKMFTNSFNAFERGFIGSVLFLKKNKKIIGSAMIFGIIGGLAYSLLGKPFYNATMVIKSNDNYLEKNVFTKVLDELNIMCDEEDYNELANLLEISVESAQSIRSFELEEEKEVANMGAYYAKYMNVLSSVTDEEKREELLNTFIKSEKDNIYYISVSAYNDSVLPLLNEPLAKLMNANPYFVKKREINKITMEFNEQKIYDELSKLDTLKKTLTNAIELNEKNMKSGSNNIFLGETQLYNPLPVYDKYIALYSEAIALKKQLFFNEYTVDVLSGFVKLAKNERLNPFLASLCGAGIGLVAGIFFVLFMLSVEKFNALEEKHVSEQKING